MRKMIKFTMLSVLVFLSTLIYAIDLPHFFSNNMVLQRERPVSIWGNADRGEKVTVSLNGNTVKVNADAKGKWKAELPEMPAGGPYEMAIYGKKDKIVFKNILVGDVWLCSGQSNMEWMLKNSDNGADAVKTSGNGNIRLLTVPKVIKPALQDDIEKSGWVECNPETTPDFSAVAYFFGKELQAETNVPIGLIHSSWGGTDIQTWIGWESMRTTDEYSNYARKNYEDALGYSERDIKKYETALQNDKGLAGKWFSENIGLKNWKKIAIPQRLENVMGDVDGIVWFRKEVDLPSGTKGKSGVIHLCPIDDEDVTYINGVKVASGGGWNMERNYSVPAGVLKDGKNVIAIRVKDSGGDGGIVGRADQLFLEINNSKYPLAGEWQYMPAVLNKDFGIRSNGPNNFSSLLYNGMLYPLAGYGIKGAIWYQGENNAEEAYRYRALFPDMIKDWRKLWGYDFPFFWVQLANFKAVNGEPMESSWAELREAQNMTLKLPKTGQAVITDIGEAFDIHPRNKKDVGYRLAQNALKVAYGRNIAGCGPVYESMKTENDRVILKFSNTGGGLTTKEKNRYSYVNGFTIAGADQKFVWAKAYIDGDNVVVFSEKVANPVAVRYGWCDNPYDNNLVNGEGLLASPFRTDSWKGITESNNRKK